MWLLSNYEKNIGKSVSDFHNQQTYLTLDDPERGHFKVTKVKIEHSVVAVALRPRVSMDKNVHHCPLSKSAS
jgi:hypothetical protein